MAVTLLTVYPTTTHDAILATANDLATTTGGNIAGVGTTKIGQSLGFGEIQAQAIGTAWPALQVIAAPSGNGYVLNSTLLNGQQIVLGNWTPTLRYLLSSGNIIADLYVRAFYLSALVNGTFAAIGNMVNAGVTITSPSGNFTWNPTNLGLMNFPTGSFLYLDTQMNITTNNSGNNAATIRIAQSNIAGQGNAGDQIVTPGFQPIPAGGLAIGRGQRYARGRNRL
jgi:hypothetical protein